MTSNKYIEYFRLIRDDVNLKAITIINRYNDYNNNDILHPLTDESIEIVKAWEANLFGVNNLTDRDINDTLYNHIILKNIDIDLCNDFLFNFRICDKRQLNEFINKIRSYDKDLLVYLQKKIKRCIKNGIYGCNKLYKIDSFSLQDKYKSGDSLYYSILEHLYLIENGDYLPDDNICIKSLSLWKTYDIPNRLVNSNDLVITFRELVISVAKEHKKRLDNNQINTELTKYENIASFMVDDTYLEQYLNNIFDNWKSPDSDSETEQYKLRLIAYYAVIANKDTFIGNFTLYNIILGFDTYPSYIYNNAPCYPDTDANVIEILALSTIIKYNIIVLNKLDTKYYFNNNNGFNSYLDDTIYLYQDEYMSYNPLIVNTNCKNDNNLGKITESIKIKLKDDNYVVPDKGKIEQIIYETNMIYEESVKQNKALYDVSDGNSQMDSSVALVEKNKKQIDIVLESWTPYEYKRLSNYTGLILKDSHDINSFNNTNKYKTIINGIKHVKTYIMNIFTKSNDTIKSKITDKFFRQEIIALLERTSNIKKILKLLNSNEITNLSKIIKFLTKNTRDIKSIDDNTKIQFIIDNYSIL